MAHRGSFGRRRLSGSSNLTSLVAQLMREQRSAEDRAIFDAYQNGGLFKGKGVDDKRILAYMTGRRNGFSKDDPLYDEWNNRLIQTKFSIGEQKIGLAFKQGKASAGAVASYYRNSLKDIPKDSAFYRDVAGRAAQWAKSAGSAARGRARGRASGGGGGGGGGLRGKLNDLIQKGAEFDGLERALTEYAKRQGLISGNQKLTDADASDLQEMFNRGIYAGADQITFEDFQTAAKQQYGLLDKQFEIQIALGNQGTDYRKRRDRFLADTLVGLNTIDERTQYESARETWDQAIAAAKGDPYAIAEANADYVKTLGKVYTNSTGPSKALDANSSDFIGALVNEVDAITTGKYSGPTATDLFDDSGDGNADAKSSAESAVVLQTWLTDLDSGKAYYGQTEPGGDLGVQYPTGPIGGLDDSLQVSVTTINGIKREVRLKGQAVTASAVSVDGVTLDPADPAFAQKVAQARAEGTLDITESGSPAGYIFTNPSNGSVKYGVYDAEGNMLFTEKSPWAVDGQTGIAYNGGVPTVFTGATREDAKGRLVPSVTGITTVPVSMDTMDPLLADENVKPKDLLALLDSGTSGVKLTEDALQKYRMRLQKQEAERVTQLSQRDLGIADRMGIGMQPTPTRGGGGDLRSSILDGMASIKDVTTELFAGKDKATDMDLPPSLRVSAPVAPVDSVAPVNSENLKPDGTPKDEVRVVVKPPVYSAPSQPGAQPKPQPVITDDAVVKRDGRTIL